MVVFEEVVLGAFAGDHHGVFEEEGADGFAVGGVGESGCGVEGSRVGAFVGESVGFVVLEDANVGGEPCNLVGGEFVADSAGNAVDDGVEGFGVLEGGDNSETIEDENVEVGRGGEVAGGGEEGVCFTVVGAAVVAGGAGIGAVG